MKMVNHIIHKQTFHLSVDAEDVAHSIREKVQETYYSKVLPAFEDVFTRLSPDQKIYRFDNLEIDIGHLVAENIEADLSAKISTLAEKLIRDKINAADFSSFEEKGVEVIQKHESVFEAFLFFLQTGLLPWWFSGGNNKTPEELFVDVIRHGNAQNISKLKSVLQTQSASLRLVTQFSGTFTNRLFVALVKQEQSALRQAKVAVKSPMNDSGLISILRKELLAALKKLGISAEIQQKVNASLLQSFMANDLAFRFFPRFHDGKKLSADLDEMIGEVFHVLVDILGKEGLKKEEVSMKVSRISAALPRNSYTGFWVSQHKSDLVDLEKFAAGNTRSSAIKIKNLKDLKLAEMQIEKLAEEGIYIQNAGLVLLWPFLKHFFGQLFLLGEDGFATSEKRARAVQLLHYISTGNEFYAEQQMALNKILCGMSLKEPLYSCPAITDMEKEETEMLITTAISKWEAVGKLSVRGFRESFLMREGRLSLTDAGWMLKVNRKAYDMLIERLPWSISMIKYKWMDRMIYVEW